MFQQRDVSSTISVSDQPTTYDYQSVTALLCVPIFLVLAIVLAFVELFTHRHRSMSFHADVEIADRSRQPLLKAFHKSGGLRKTRTKWWQFWRRASNANTEQTPFTSPAVRDYGALELHHLYEKVPKYVRSNPSAFRYDYKLIRTVSDSNQGPVHLVRHLRTRKQYVIKQLACQSTKGKTPRWPIEAEIMEHLAHPNIIRLQHVDVQFPMANVVMEFCEKGDVMNYLAAIEDRGTQVPAQFILHFISSMIDALAHIHYGKYPILHRDIKSQNIFLKFDKQSKYGLPTIVLADFGIASTADDNIGLPGTDLYMPPELLKLRKKYESSSARLIKGADPWKQKGHHTTGTDMFSFGATLLELLTLDNDIPKTPANITPAWKTSGVSDRPEILELLLDCLSSNPTRRPGADTLAPLSETYKSELQKWYISGGQLAEDEFPDAFYDDPEGNSRRFKTTTSSPRTYLPIASRVACRWP